MSSQASTFSTEDSADLIALVLEIISDPFSTDEEVNNATATLAAARKRQRQRSANAATGSSVASCSTSVFTPSSQDGGDRSHGRVENITTTTDRPSSPSPDSPVRTTTITTAANSDSTADAVSDSSGSTTGTDTDTSNRKLRRGGDRRSAQFGRSPGPKRKPGEYAFYFHTTKGTAAEWRMIKVIHACTSLFT